MATGQSITLYQGQQKLLALWATKTAIALLAAGDPQYLDLVPVDHRRIIREQGELPPQTWIGFIPWSAGPHAFFGPISVKDPVNPAHVLKGYSVLFCFAQLAFKAVGIFDALPPTMDLAAIPPGISRFWPPPNDPIKWPPMGITAARSELPTLANFSPLIRKPQPLE